MMTNRLYYGDNIDVMRQKLRDETVDLCYIDPPFNSQRNYNQIYNNIGKEDRALAQAFVDTWTWDDRATKGYNELLSNSQGRFQSSAVELIRGLHSVLGAGSLLAYLVSMTLRITEIHRILKPTGSFYLHCDPTSSHYLKLILDATFCRFGGDFRNEIIWAYESGGRSKKDFGNKHDVIFRYTKSKTEWLFNAEAVHQKREDVRKNHMKKQIDENGKLFWSIRSAGKIYKYYADEGVIPSDVWSDISHLQQKDPERLGYPTQKPEALLERIILASSDEDDLVLDAYCGCGTTVAVSQRLKRRWIGIDITYQSISLILRRLEHTYGKEVVEQIIIDGIPRDMESVQALVHKKDDRLRKEFEKWAILTYTNNRAVINQRKGADAGVDAQAFFMTGKSDNAKIIFQVKSGSVKRSDIATLNGDMHREKAVMACFITLEKPSGPMRVEAKQAGLYRHETMGRDYNVITIVTVKEILESGKRLEIPMSLEVVAKAKRAADETQIDLI